MMMKTKHSKYFIIFLFLAIISDVAAQKDFSPKQRDRIADNVDEMVKDFAASLEFDITIDEQKVNNLKAELGDSLAAIEINNLKLEKREQAKEKIFTYFGKKRQRSSSTIANFFFDKSIVSADELNVEEFVGKYTLYYDKTVKGDVPILYDETNLELRPLMRKLKIDKARDGHAVVVNFQIARLQMFYDTLINNMEGIPNADDLPEDYENFNVNIAAKVTFEDYDDPESFSFLSLSKPGLGGGMKFKNDRVNEYIDPYLIENFNLYSNISELDQPPDLSLSKLLIDLFNDPDKKSIQCDLFFSDEVCDGQTDISVREYVDMLAENYEFVYPIQVIPDYDELTKVTKTKAYYLFKLPVKFAFEARMNNGEFFENNDQPHTKSDTTSCNFFIKLDYKKPLFSDEEEYTSVKLTDVAFYDKRISISPVLKKGNWSVMAKYQPGMILFSPNEAFETYKNEFSLSNGIGVSGQYYWFAQEDNLINYNVSYGVSLGLNYEMYNSIMSFDSYTYDDIIPGINQGEPFNDLNFVNELIVEMAELKQELTVNTISIPIMGHYKKNINETTFLDLAGGVKLSIPLQESISLESNGSVTYTGIKKDVFGEETEYYYIDYLPSKGFDTFNDIQSNTPEVNTLVTYIILNPSISFSIDNTIENGFIDFGLTFQYGFNDMFSHTDKEYMADSFGQLNNVYSNGLKNNHMIVGFTLGFRYFDEMKEKIFKPIND